MKDILDKLNVPQREAVLTTEGPVLILAGAGSGKTRALTHRIAYLIEEKGVDPWHILAITFTNKAAEEMRNRVRDLCERGDGVFVATFHSTCLRILRAGADRLGYGSDFTIYDTDDSRVLMRQIIREKDLDPKLYREKDVLREISGLKNELVTAAEYAARPATFRERHMQELYSEYQKRLLLSGAMDFDDLLMNAVLLFRENEDLLERYRNRFRYILVDEYQDTNTAQFAFVELLAHEHRNLCVVGDDDQSIYKFRGANIRNILNFEEAFAGAKVIRLEQNYRSTKNILAAANQVIAHNAERKDKTLWSDKEEGEKVRFREYPDAYEEARAIVKDIEQDRQRFAYSDCAVLYRTNAQSRILEEKFVELGVPYRLIGGTNFYERREVKDLLAYLKTVANAQDDLAVCRIINVPRRGIGDSTVEKIRELAREEGLTFYEALKRAARLPEFKRSAGKLSGFADQIEDYRRKAETMKLSGLLWYICESSGYLEYLKEEGEIEAEARRENLEELKSKAEQYGSGEGRNAEAPAESGEKTAAEVLGDFLTDVALVSEVDAYQENEDRVVLMTLHSAKGLEFPKVYISGMEQDVFPGARALYSGDPSDLEEERRLCYVGFTRAMEKLILTAARQRMLNGQTQIHAVSQFIEEIDPNYLQRDRRGFMESREEGRSRQAEKAYLDGYGGSPDWGSRWLGRGADSARAGGWTDFGDSFGFMPQGGAKARPKRQEPPADDILSYFGRRAEAAAKPSAEESALKPGDRVRQKRFGEGTVVAVEQGKKDLEVTVDFDKYGRKVMLAGFAGFEKIGGD